MRFFRKEGPLHAGLLILTPLILRLASASPAVNVGLRASWNGAPFLLELLETAAEENPASYFPLASRIATGSFADYTSDKDLYDAFLEAANADGFLSDPAELASFNFALSIHSAAPRIEANYQYYQSYLEPLMGKLYRPNASVWLQWDSKQVGDSGGDFASLLKDRQRFPNDRRKLQFERVFETEEDAPAAILYADLQAPEFGSFHTVLKEAAERGELSYRIRYRPPPQSTERPVVLSGYGVELALKKTDYMVMDDREVQGEGEDEAKVKSKGDKKSQAPLGQLEDAEIDDIKPLPQKEIITLGQKAATFVMKSEDPFTTLSRLLQDFPKHSSAVAAVDVDEDLIKEHIANWEMFAGFGMNLMWINGLQLENNRVNAFALLEHLRRERKYINGLKALGLSSSEAIQLLSHEILAEARQEKAQRFDFRDDIEGGNVISWMNDLELDRRYKDWPSTVNVLLRRVFPGQLHQLRKNVHHIVLPIDFSSREDLFLVAENLKPFVQRKIAIRFGLVPLVKTQEAIDQAKIYYYLIDTYGLAAALNYAEQCVATSKTETIQPDEKIFDSVQKQATLRRDKVSSSYEQVLADDSLQEKIESSRKWVSRLGADSTPPTLFLNGQPLLKDEDWMQTMTSKLQMDIMFTQRAVYEQIADDNTDFVELFLEGAAKRRNNHIFPKEDASIKLINVAEITSSAAFKELPTIATDKPDADAETSIWIVGDFDEEDGYELLVGAAELQKENPGVNLVLINNPEISEEKPTLSALLFRLQKAGFFTEPERLRRLLELKPKDGSVLSASKALSHELLSDAKIEGWQAPDQVMAADFWKKSRGLLKGSGIKAGQRGIIVNGRVIGPIPRNESFIPEDFQQLLDFEHAKRIKPVLQAAKKLGVEDKISGGSLGLAALTNQVALTTVAEVPPGLFETPDFTRSDLPNKMLKGQHTAIEVGDKDSALVHILASVDPASEAAQKWVPILKVLSEMHGVYLQLFLNPERTMSELPIKRFYRHVLQSKPSFDTTGHLVGPRAHFENIPEKALLSLSMEVPPSWLVTPKESIHDLDNIKLDVMKERLRGSDIEALYELRSILIEGHSRDITAGGVPRGAQLVLGTEKDPHYADTIIMANLGYFQFKANPGFWRIDLMDGRSKEIFSIDTIGNGANPADEDTPKIALMSFQGVTLFPKFSRNPGMLKEDVLEPSTTETNNPLDLAKKWLKKAGLHSGTDNKHSSAHADINIFSVASGHLYERFLNIMMLSVIKNTDKTVKFWFIENFLSPSFKDFIPSMAAEYGFDYELVTYKWPHWLRAQKEKQREIWGYKILFLDVLFPLDLDKVIFVDADQIVRTDLAELVALDLHGAPYGFTPMCDSREEIEGFRFWKQGYWKSFLRGLPYHISALYVVDLKRFRQIAAGDRLRQQYHTLSADPGSLSNLDQDLPNHMQSILPIYSLPQEWLWCETWCSDESLKDAKTIDLCNNPMTKEPKLERARRQIPEWTVYDEEVAALARRKAQAEGKEAERAGHLGEGVQAQVAEEAAHEHEHEKEHRKEDEEKEEQQKEKEKERIKDEL